MSLVLIKRDTLTNLADTIRLKNGEDISYKPSEMPEAIKKLNAHKTLTLKIDLTNSSPSTCVSLTDDCKDMTQDELKAWFGYYPVLFKNGAEIGKLNPDNYAKFKDGTAAAITTLGNDVMVAFPRRGLTINTVNNVVTVSFTREPNDTNFEYNAHTRGTTAKDVFYMGAYKGYVSSSKLYSSSGKTPGSTHTITEFRTYAQARGTGYEQLGWYQLIYIQCVYLMIFQNLNSQATIGYGYVHPDNTASVKTGNTNAYGMNCELIKATNPTYMTDKKHQVKCLGIEDCWGNKWVFIDGLVVNSSYKILTANSSFNNTGSGYTNNGAIGATKEIVSLYIKTPVGTTKTGFLLKTDNGDTSTQYFCDRGQIKAGYIPIHGGRWLGNVAAGIFETALDASTTTSSINTGARLMYL